MKLKQITTFVTLYETLSLSETSDKLSISVSAVIKRLKSLEDSIGQRLFVMSGKVTPTKFAENMYPDSRKVAMLFFDLFSDPNGKKSKSSMTKINIGTIAACVLDVGQAIASISDAMIFDANVIYGSTISLVDSLLIDRIQIAYTDAPSDLPLSSKIIGYEKMVLLLHSSQQNNIEVIDRDFVTILKKNNIIGLNVEANLSLSALTEHILNKNNIHLPSQFLVNSPQIIPYLVSKNIGVGIVPSSFVESCQYENITVIPIENKEFVLPKYISWNPLFENPTRDYFVKNHIQASHELAE